MNEYDILLSYLEKKDRPNLSKKKIKSFEDIPKEKPVEISQTKRIIEECQEEKKPLDAPQFTNNTSVGFDVDKFEDMMRSRLIDDYKKMQSYERPNISVTELFYCMRKSYYSRLKYATDLKKQFSFAYLDLINRIGNEVHDYIQEIYNFAETEKTIVSEKYKVKGRCDAITQPILYEIKTLDEKKFTGIYVKEHYYQPIIYAYLLNTEYNYKITTITLIYVFRDNIKRRPYVIDLPTDDKVAIGFLEQSLVLQNSIISKQVPEPFNATKDQCQWCPYISYCEKDPSKLLKPFSSKVKVQKELTLDLTESPKKEKVKEQLKPEKKKESVFLL